MNYVCRGANCKDNRSNKNLKRKFNSRIRDGSVNWIQSQAEAARKIPIVLDLMSDPTLLYIIQEYLENSQIEYNEEWKANYINLRFEKEVSFEV